MKKILFSVAAAALMSTSAFAATNSTGDAEINVTIDPFVSISGLDDLTIDIAPGSISSSAPDNRAGEDVTYFCVFSNVTAAGTYTITATSEYEGSAGNPFGLRSPQGTQLNYMASFRDQGTGSPFVDGGFLARNQARQATTTAGGQNRPTDFNCSNVTGGSNAAIGIGVRNSVALAALAGEYTGKLTVTVAVP